MAKRVLNEENSRLLEKSEYYFFQRKRVLIKKKILPIKWNYGNLTLTIKVKKNLMPAALLLKADKKAELKAKQICSSGPLVA